MTATATERFTNSMPMRTDRELLVAGAMPAPKLALPTRFADIASADADEVRAARRTHPVFHWG